MKILKVFAIFSAAVLMVACGSSKVEGSKEVRDLLPSKGELDTTSYMLGVNFGLVITQNNFGDLNMDMLRTFFEKSEEDTSVYFRNRNIWKCGSKYREYQGKYPVIFVSFKDVKCPTWEDTYDNICKLLQSEFARHLELLESDKLSSYDKRKIRSILDGKASRAEMEAAFATLSELLDKHYGIPAIIIVDEYDTPIQQGYVEGFYDAVIQFMRNLFSG